MSVILARPHGVNTGSGSGFTQTIVSVVLPGNTVVVDSVPTASSKLAKWFVVVEDVVTSATQAYEILALHKDGLTSTHNQTGILGDIVNHSVTVVIVGTDLTLQITNNEANNLQVDATRIEILT